MCNSWLQYAARSLIGICLLSWTALLAHAQPTQGLERSEALRCALTGNAIPSGLVVLLPSGEKNYQSMNLQVLSNPFMSGVAVQINWRDIEPVQGKPDWTQLDALFAAAESSKKWVHLIMFPGFFSPPWALEGAQSDQFTIQYGPGEGTDARLPIPWDRVYLDRWFTFMKLLSARYGGSPAKYLGAWDEVFRFYAGAFANQCISLSAPGLPILGHGEKGRPAHLRARQEIIERAMRVLGNRLAIQFSDLHAGHAAIEAPDETDFIIGYSGRIITGLEMRSGSQGDIASKIMGAEGNPPLALRKSIDKGMVLNNAGRHVNYLEIYVADVIPADMQPDLSYAASLFRR
jgi:hypothetical protein